MALPSVTYQFVSGTASDANQVNTNFTNIISALTDGTKDLTVNALSLTADLTVLGNTVLGNTSGDTTTFTMLTATTVPYIDASKFIKSSAVTPTELALLSGLTSLKNITNWGATAWTPTGSWSTNTTYTGSYRREGDTGFFTVKIALAGAPTAANLTVNLPGSHTIDTTKLPGYDSTFKEVGLASFFDTSASAGYTGMACYNSTTSVKVMINAQAIHAGTVFTRILACDNTSPVTFASGDMVTLTFSVPIVEYA